MNILSFTMGSLKGVFGYSFNIWGSLHPGKLIWNPKIGGLEDDFPFQLDDFQVPCSFSMV